MAFNPFRTARPGDKLRDVVTADWVNEVTRAAQWVREQQFRQTAAHTDRQQAGLAIRCYNGQPAALQANWVVRLGNIMGQLDSEPVRADPLPSLQLPGSGTQFDFTAASSAPAQLWGITAEPMPSGSVGLVKVAGVAMVRVQFAANTDTWAQPIGNDWEKLQSHAVYGTARIIQAEAPSAGNPRWAAVLLGVQAQPMLWRGVTSAAISKDTSGTVRRWTSVDTGIDDTVWNPFAHIGSGRDVNYWQFQDRFVLVSAECG